MAKGSLLMGKQSGKLGQSVLSTRYGEQIQRAYVKEIANPKTEAQVATRSRFKLASQLSAAMADVIAIPRVGAKTGRNQFVSATMDITSEDAGVAQVNLNAVQLTKSQRGLVGFAATRDQAGNKISIALKSANGSSISRVVYVAFVKQNDGSLVQFDSKVVDVPGADGTFPSDLKYTADSVVLYAYGITDKDGAVSVKFGNLIAPSAEQIAELLTTSSDTMSGVTLTKTNGATMNAGTNACDSDDNVSPVPNSFRAVTYNTQPFNNNFIDQPAGDVFIGGFVDNASENVSVGCVEAGPGGVIIGQSYPIIGAASINANTGAFASSFTSQEASTYYLVIGARPDADHITPAVVYPYILTTEDNEP